MSRTYEFTSRHLGLTKRYEANDGFQAWQMLTTEIGPLPLFNDWSLSPVCLCGKSGRGYAYCSERCFEANARLIAAAPETLEALKVLISRLEAEDDSGQCLADQLGFEYDDARKAIARAEGRDNE